MHSENSVTVADLQEVIETYKFLYVALVDRVDKHFGMSVSEFKADLLRMRPAWIGLLPPTSLGADRPALQIYDGVIDLMAGMVDRSRPGERRQPFAVILGGKSDLPPKG